MLGTTFSTAEALMLCNKGTASAGPQQWIEKQEGFSPCIRLKPGAPGLASETWESTNPNPVMLSEAKHLRLILCAEDFVATHGR